MTLTEAATALAVISLAATGCGGGGSPEEAVETFNGHMAAKDFERAAAVVYLREWAGLPAADVGARRAAYAGYLAKQYDDEGLDYGRAEITGREKAGPDAVEFVVIYPLRSRPAAARVTRAMAVTRIDGLWYYVPGRRQNF